MMLLTILGKDIMTSEKILDFPVDCNTLTGSYYVDEETAKEISKMWQPTHTAAERSAGTDEQQ